MTEKASLSVSNCLLLDINILKINRASPRKEKMIYRTQFATQQKNEHAKLIIHV